MECRFCGRHQDHICRNTREMEDASDKVCYAALMFRGGGEYIHNQRQSQLLYDKQRKKELQNG